MGITQLEKTPDTTTPLDDTTELPITALNWDLDLGLTNKWQVSEVLLTRKLKGMIEELSKWAIEELERQFDSGNADRDTVYNLYGKLLGLIDQLTEEINKVKDVMWDLTSPEEIIELFWREFMESFEEIERVIKWNWNAEKTIKIVKRWTEWIIWVFMWLLNKKVAKWIKEWIKEWINDWLDWRVTRLKKLETLKKPVDEKIAELQSIPSKLQEAIKILVKVSAWFEALRIYLSGNFKDNINKNDEINDELKTAILEEIEKIVMVLNMSMTRNNLLISNLIKYIEILHNRALELGLQFRTAEITSSMAVIQAIVSAKIWEVDSATNILENIEKAWIEFLIKDIPDHLRQELKRKERKVENLVHWTSAIAKLNEEIRSLKWNIDTTQKAIEMNTGHIVKISETLLRTRVQALPWHEEPVKKLSKRG